MEQSTIYFAVSLQKAQYPPKCLGESQDDNSTPLAAWFAEISQSLKTRHLEEKIEGKKQDIKYF